jgi:hypothetical protein
MLSSIINLNLAFLKMIDLIMISDIKEIDINVTQLVSRRYHMHATRQNIFFMHCYFSNFFLC